MHHPSELMHSITVAHSRLPGWTDFALPRLSAHVTTIDAVITPIMKPVSSKLYMSPSPIPYLAIMLRNSANHFEITTGSS
ncbi:hypothetical protein CCHR01_17510 [Colletotrichum chrysophilum]|uniref:Uncharacterized protein n=1 Tax=Colletotrichum chrysophilum TaxID=1836956 RepID=A0AAD9A2E9_9PEZI|nr:hypothetical protein CCHR01_17510 [Colletotrichum chrysophilum]